MKRFCCVGNGIVPTTPVLGTGNVENFIQVDIVLGARPHAGIDGPAGGVAAMELASPWGIDAAADTLRPLNSPQARPCSSPRG